MDKWIDERVEQTNLNVLMLNKCLPSVLRNLDQSYFYKYHIIICTYINILLSFVRNRNISVSLWLQRQEKY